MGLLEWIKRLFGRATTEIEPASPPDELERLTGVSPFPPGTGPSRLIIMRHAEKSGDRNDPHLSLPGRKRAEQLVHYLPATFGQPEFLMAARTSVRSRRPVETLEPLAAALSLEVRAKFADNDAPALIETLRDKKRYRGKTGVICWRHSALPRLAASLGAASGAVPASWEDDDYITIIDVTFPGNGETRTRRLQMPL